MHQDDWIAREGEGARRRDVGIDRAVARANRVSESWSDRAYWLLEQYARRAAQPFLAESFVGYAKGLIEAPPDGRAWGGIVRRAALAGVIVRVGYAPAETSNHSPKCLWRGAQP